MLNAILFPDTMKTKCPKRLPTNRAGIVAVALALLAPGSLTPARATVTERALLLPNDSAARQAGDQVALAGDVAVVGSKNYSSLRGGVFVYERQGEQWPLRQLLLADPDRRGGNFDFHQFGHGVAISGQTIVVGCPGDRTQGGSGAVYVFVRGDGFWTRQAYLRPADGAGNSAFGTAVAIADDVLVASSRGIYDAPDATVRQGRLHVFQRTEGNWTEVQTLDSPYSFAPSSGLDQRTAGFGLNLALTGDTLVAGVPDDHSAAGGVDGNHLDQAAAQSGAAWVYRNVAGAWIREAYLKASNPHPRAKFGHAVALAGDRLVVGAPEEASAGIGVNGDQTPVAGIRPGAAYVFHREGATWAQRAYLKPAEQNHARADKGDKFGISVALAGGAVLVGAEADDHPGRGINPADPAATGAIESGAAYLFQLSAAGDWAQTAFIKAKTASPGEVFGRSVALAGSFALVGVPGKGSGFVQGAAYIFSFEPVEEPVVQELVLSGFNLERPVTPGPLSFSVALSGPPGALVVLEGTADLSREDGWKEAARATLDAQGRGSLAGPAAADQQFYRLSTDAP